jgi:hypothetical protein
MVPTAHGRGAASRRPSHGRLGQPSSGSWRRPQRPLMKWGGAWSNRSRDGCWCCAFYRLRGLTADLDDIRCGSPAGYVVPLTALGVWFGESEGRGVWEVLGQRQPERLRGLVQSKEQIIGAKVEELALQLTRTRA